jgi:hypothetical protein
MSSNSFLGTIAVFQGKQGKFYMLRGFKYDIHFPLAWAIDDDYMSGPEDCDNCRFHGMINDVFVGYCMNCSIHCYNSERGFTQEVLTDISEEMLWEQLPYMKGIPKAQIGDNDKQVIIVEELEDEQLNSQESGYEASTNISEVTSESSFEDYGDQDLNECVNSDIYYENGSQDSPHLSAEQVQQYIDEYQSQN